MSNDQYEPRRDDQQSWQDQPADQNLDDTRFTPAASEAPAPTYDSSAYGQSADQGQGYPSQGAQPAGDAYGSSYASSASSASGYPSNDQTGANAFGSAAPSAYPSADQAASSPYGTAAQSAQSASGYPQSFPASAPSASGYPAAQQGYPASAPSASGYPAAQQGYPASAQSASFPAQQGYSQQGYPQQGVQGPQKKNGLAALFDFSFNTFVTPSIVKIAYILLVVVNAGGWLLGTIMTFVAGAGMSAFTNDGGSMILGVLSLLFGWIPALFNIAVGRLFLEFCMITFKLHEKVGEIDEKITKDA